MKGNREFSSEIKHRTATLKKQLQDDGERDRRNEEHEILSFRRIHIGFHSDNIITKLKPLYQHRGRDVSLKDLEAVLREIFFQPTVDCISVSFEEAYRMAYKHIEFRKQGDKVYELAVDIIDNYLKTFYLDGFGRLPAEYRSTETELACKVRLCKRFDRRLQMVIDVLMYWVRIRSNYCRNNS